MAGGDDAFYTYVVGSDEIDYVFVVGERVWEVEEVEGHIVLHWRHIESMGKYGIARNQRKCHRLNGGGAGFYSLPLLVSGLVAGDYGEGDVGGVSGGVVHGLQGGDE